MSVVRVVLMAVVIRLLVGLPQFALAREGAPSGVCSAAWVIAERTAAQERGEHFGILPDAAFQELGYAYVAGVSVAEGPDASSLTLLIFGRKEGEYQKIHAEQIETLAPRRTRLAADLGYDCVVPPVSPWFTVTVDDLDGDGRYEIIVESNASGGCSGCLSELRVYQVKGATALKALQETYHQLIFGRGRGLVLESLGRGPDGEIIPVVKDFFTPSGR